MPRFVALLRGVNVGGHHSMPMARLRSFLEGLGYEGVATLLQSGNAVFTAKERNARKLEKALSQALEEEFGFPVPVIIRTHDELRALIAESPFEKPEKDHKAHYLFFLAEPLEAKGLALMDAEKYKPDTFVIRGSHIYARFSKGLGTSKLGTLLSGTRLGVVLTGRNWRTTESLLELSAP